MGDELTSPKARVYSRASLEFERVAFFSDAIFAIAMTLLVVGLDVPQIADETSSGELWDALRNSEGKIVIFFVSFAVLGSFWMTHHRYMSKLTAVDGRAMAVILAYLAMIAFLPFPSGILGEYGDNSVAVAFYAITIAATAIVSVLMHQVAIRHDLLQQPPPPAARRWQVVLPLVPAAYFLATVPLAFVSPSAALYSWILLAPLGAFLGRRVPKELNEYFD